MEKKLEIFVSAGDASSEMHAAQAVEALKKLSGENVEVFGLIGTNLLAQGATALLETKEFSVGGGPLEVIGKLPKRMRLERLLEQRLSQKRPDVALLVDNGEINLRLAALLHFFNIPVVYYIPPKLWVWRQKRIIPIAYHVKKVLSILPFEKPLYDEWEIPFQYVGNPLLDEVPTSPSRSASCKRLGIDESRNVVLVMLGSRHSEIRFHKKIFLDSLKRFHQKLEKEGNEKLKKPLYVFPLPATVNDPQLSFEIMEQCKANGMEALVLSGQSHDCMIVARAALIKSGTSTLEAAALECPMVVAYQSGLVARFFFHFILRYKDHVSLANLFLAHKKPAAVEEHILERCTVDNLSNGLFKVYVDGPFREKQLAALSKTRQLLQPPRELQKTSPSEVVASEILEVIKESHK